MEYSIVWQPLALESFYDESDFIFLKWNVAEVEKFSELVEESILRLKSKPEIGKFNPKKKTY
jgi:plasmid stabilization system protein ParE